MTDSDLTRMRRSDRAVTDEAWIRAALHQAATGVLATAVDGQPFLNSNLFVYDEQAHAIYLHTAREGRTRSTVEANDRVCFTVFELGRLLPAATALEFSCEYASVVVFGRGYVVTEPEEQRHALQLLLDKYFPDKRPGHDYHAITDDELARTSVFRVGIDEWSGKWKRVESELPEARPYSLPGIMQTET